MPVDWYRVITELNEARMSYRQIARECHVTYQTIGNWRWGVTEPTYSKGERLLEIHRTVIPSTA